jgi:hypothetical protein
MGWPAPILVFFYTLIVKRCALDGWAGWLYVLQRTFAEVALAMEIVDRHVRSRAPPETSGSRHDEAAHLPERADRL